MDHGSHVHVGKYGWLYLAGGSNEVLRQFQSPSTFTPHLAEMWVQLLVKRAHQAERLGMRYHHVMVPEKLAVYPEFTGPDIAVDAMQAPSWTLPLAIQQHPMSSLLDHVWIDVRGPLRAARHQTDVFWRTDSHWTPDGAFVAYQQICARLGLTWRPELRERPTQRATVSLDLGGQVTPRVTEDFAMRNHTASADRVYANRIVEFKEQTGRENDGGLHVGSRVRFRNESDEAADVSIMLFGDSFSEYRPFLLTGLLAETVRSLDFVWSAAIDWDMVERESPDVVVSELAERFHVRPPSDEGFTWEGLEETVLRQATTTRPDGSEPAR